MRGSISTAAAGLLLVTASSRALTLNLDDPASIKSATKSIASAIMREYSQGLNSEFGITGIFDAPVYWWEAGFVWDSLINYWAVTGDDTFNDQVTQALVWQNGSGDFMPVNQTGSEGNDDQSIWALAAMTAAESGFPAPPSSSGTSSWLSLAENVFNSQVARWNPQTCNGGLRWQIYMTNAGYNYKNAMSNGNFFQLAARLAHFTGNQTYTQWAIRMSEWSTEVGMVHDDQVYDGADVTDNCSQFNHVQWTSNMGTYLSAYAYMASQNTSAQWASVTTNLVTSLKATFATPPNSPVENVLTEVACTGFCRAEMHIYRGVLARALANTQALTTDTTLQASIKALVQASAQGAAAQCSGSASSIVCGRDWASDTYDGTSGLEQDVSALNIILANLPAAKIRTASSGGTGTPSGTPSGTAPGTPSGSVSSTTSIGAGPTATPNSAACRSVSLLAVAAVGLLVASAC